MLSEDKQHKKEMDFICHKNNIQVENTLNWERIVNPRAALDLWYLQQSPRAPKDVQKMLE